jgi:hypothetical protein
MYDGLPLLERLAAGDGNKAQYSSQQGAVGLVLLCATPSGTKRCH